MLRAIVIDDESAGINTMNELIKRYPELIRLVASTAKAEEGLKLIEDYRPDLVFLDVSMPDMSGFELLDKLNFRDFKLVFTTAHKEYALQAIKNNAFDYLLKPLVEEDFKNCIENLEKALDAKGAERSTIRTEEIVELVVRDGIIYLKQKDIIRIEAAGSYTYFYCEGGFKHLASKKIKDYEALLNPRYFFRCHNSHVVNLTKVLKFVSHDGFFALMNDGAMVDISRRNKELFLERIKNV